MVSVHPNYRTSPPSGLANTSQQTFPRSQQSIIPLCQAQLKTLDNYEDEVWENAARGHAAPETT